jgi:cell division protein FtsB
MDRKLRYQISKLILPGIAFGLLLYIIYHIFSGDHGWLAWRQLKGELSEAQESLTSLEKEKSALEHRVQLLRPESLDLDMLDERVRAVLNNSDPNDIIAVKG